MEAFEIAAELNMKKIVAEVKEVVKAMNEFANDLEQIEKKYADGIQQETVTEFADRCRECGARYGRLLNQKWIPVSERLPGKGKEVLIYIDQFPYLATYEDGEWETEDFTVDLENEPIAWFELPEPYNAESEEKK